MGILSIKVPKWGSLIIRDLCLFQKGGQKWISFPSRPYEEDGKKKYFHYLQFEDANMMSDFQKKILQALDEYLSKTKEPTIFQEKIPF
jgi:hypothetical protein